MQLLALTGCSTIMNSAWGSCTTPSQSHCSSDLQHAKRWNERPHACVLHSSASVKEEVAVNTSNLVQTQHSMEGRQRATCSGLKVKAGLRQARRGSCWGQG